MHNVSHNSDILDGITAEKIKSWDGIDTLKLQMNFLSTNMTVYRDKTEKNSAQIAAIQKTLETLQKQTENYNNFITLFSQENFSKYAPEIGLILNGGYHLMPDFMAKYPHFCSDENGYALSYNQVDFGWNAEILTVCTKELNLSAKSKIFISFKSGAAEDGKLYLVEKPPIIDVPVTIYVKNKIDSGQAVSLNFKWLQADSFVSVMTECENLNSGTYYFAWTGRSNNTHINRKCEGIGVMNMKDNFCTAIGVIGGFFAFLVGGWDSALATLVTFMAVDFITGFVTAAMGKSKHSVTGRLNSKAGWIGLAKKFCILLMVVVAMRIDILLGMTYIRDATCIGFCVNELLSIVENTSLMGIPYPDSMKKAIEVLQKKAGRTDENAQHNLEEPEEKKDD